MRGTVVKRCIFSVSQCECLVRIPPPHSFRHLLLLPSILISVRVYVFVYVCACVCVCVCVCLCLCVCIEMLSILKLPFLQQHHPPPLQSFRHSLFPSIVSQNRIQLIQPWDREIITHTHAHTHTYTHTHTHTLYFIPG